MFVFIFGNVQRYAVAGAETISTSDIRRLCPPWTAVSSNIRQALFLAIPRHHFDWAENPEILIESSVAFQFKLFGYVGFFCKGHRIGSVAKKLGVQVHPKHP
jgi:hypothetical protein